jgi:AraC-like DNA-binding protein
MILLDHGGAALAHSSLIAPPLHLRALVEHAFIQTNPGHERPWRVVPDTHATLIAAFSPTSQRLHCTVVGPRSRYADIDVSRREFTCGIRLHIGALPAITGISAREYTDRSVTLESLGGSAAATLLRRIETDVRPAAIVDALFAFVAECSRGRAPSFNMNVGRATRVGEIAQRLSGATRTRYARIVAETGLSPKRLLRIERLHRALAANGAGEAWSHAAHTAGYADQSHLVREARALLGETPAQWRRRAHADSFKTRRGRPR